MPTMDPNVTLTDGTRFVTHQAGADKFIFAVRGGHVVSISISSDSIGYYRALLGGDESQTARYVMEARETTYQKSALTTDQHEAVHNLIGMTTGPNHEHFDSRKGSVYDGIQVLPLLIPKVSTTDLYTIIALAKATAN